MTYQQTHLETKQPSKLQWDRHTYIKWDHTETNATKRQRSTTGESEAEKRTYVNQEANVTPKSRNAQISGKA